MIWRKVSRVDSQTTAPLAWQCTAKRPGRRPQQGVGMPYSDFDRSPPRPKRSSQHSDYKEKNWHPQIGTAPALRSRESPSNWGAG